MKPTVYVDASALKESACDRRLLYTTYYGFSRSGESTSKYLNYKAGYGSAFHKALEFWYKLAVEDRTLENQTKAVSLALEYYQPFTQFIAESVREYRTASHLAQAIQTYFNYYTGGVETFTPISTLQEQKFVIPWYSCDKFDVVLTGTIDLLAMCCGEEVFVDHKSTGSYEPPDKYFQGYILSPQMMFYAWVLQRLVGRQLPCMINGIFLKKPTQKSSVFDGVILARSQKIIFTDKQIANFETWFTFKIKQVINYVEQNLALGSIVKPPMEYAACQGGKFGLCPYYSICSLEDELQDRVLNSIERVSYEPLRFSE